MIDNLRLELTLLMDNIKVKELADKSYALSWIEIFRNRLSDRYDIDFDADYFLQPYWINKECNKIIEEIKND